MRQPGFTRTMERFVYREQDRARVGELAQWLMARLEELPCADFDALTARLLGGDWPRFAKVLRALEGERDVVDLDHDEAFAIHTLAALLRLRHKQEPPREGLVPLVKDLARRSHPRRHAI